MVELAVFNFIFYNFRQALLTSGLIFHCWAPTTLRTFVQRASNDGLYMQYVNIGVGPSFGLDFQPHLKGQFFSIERPILGVFLDLNCAQSAAILNASNFGQLFNEHFHWVFYERSSNVNAFRAFAEHANFFVNSDVTYAITEQSNRTFRTNGNGNGNGSANVTAAVTTTVTANRTVNSTTERHFTLYDVYNNGPQIGGKLNITIDRRIICNEFDCRLDRFLSSLHQRLRFGNRNSQRDITIRIATVITVLPLSTSVPEKLKFLNSDNNTFVDPVPRFGWRQTMALMDTLYVNYNLTFFDRWAVDDVFGGSLITLVDGRSDISSTPNAMTTYRLRHFQVIAETGSFHSICLFRTPRNTGLSGSGQAFLDPFSPAVWIAFGMILLISSIQLWTMFFVEYYRLPKNLDHAPSLLTSCLITLGTACVQGAYVLPGTIGGRTTYTVVALATFIMYNYYTSIIVSTLLGSPVKSDLKTVGQIADSSLDVGFEPRPWIFSYLNSSQVPAVRRLVKKKIENRRNPLAAWVPVTEGILRIRDEIGTFAYVFEGSTGLALVEKYYKPEEICDLNEVKLRPESSLANQMPKNSSFKELFRLRLLRIVETGVNRRMTKYWLRNRLNCFSSNTIVEVGLEYTAPLFLLMLLCFLICFFVLLLEMIYYRFGKPELIKSLCLT